MKKLLVSLLCVVMMVTFMPSMAFANGMTVSDGKKIEMMPTEEPSDRGTENGEGDIPADESGEDPLPDGGEGNAEGEFAGGGTEENPYIVDSAEDLKLVAKKVNEGDTVYKKATYKLTADINLNGSKDNPWTPIGTEDNAFAGTFIGANHTIKNLYIDDENLENAGLFGYIASPAKLVGISVDGATVIGKANVGTIAGAAYTGTAENCTVTGKITVKGNYKVGGMFGGGYVKLSNCKVEAADGSSVTGEYSATNFEGDNVGGLIGFRGEGNGIVTEGCSVSGLTVAGTRKVGGLIGSVFTNNIVEACTVSNVKVVCNASKEYGTNFINSSAMAIGGMLGLYTANGNNDGILKNCTVENITLSVENEELAATDKVTMGYVSGGQRYNKAPAETITVENIIVSGTNSGSNAEEKFPGSEAMNGEQKLFANGTGTEEDPYIISSVDDLKVLADTVTKTGITYEGQYIKVADGVTFELTDDTQIGSSSKKFMGTFDGNDVTIKGITKGLFAYVKNATIKNINLIDVNITGYIGSKGALVNKATGTCTIEGITVSGSIEGGDSTGGILGRWDNSSDENLTISNCINNAAITGKGKLGGILGYAKSDAIEPYGKVVISNCSNTGDVTPTDEVGYAGGIAGMVKFAEVNNCANSGNIDGDAVAGGIIGTIQQKDSVISDCINEGSVSSKTFAGGIMGESSSGANVISRCANLGTVSAGPVKPEWWSSGNPGPMAGGITGGSRADGDEYNNCYNKGSVEATGENAFAAGITAYYTVHPVTACFNEGVIIATDGNEYQIGESKKWLQGATVPGGQKIEGCYYKDGDKFFLSDSNGTGDGAEQEGMTRTQLADELNKAGGINNFWQAQNGSVQPDKLIPGAFDDTELRIAVITDKDGNIIEGYKSLEDAVAAVKDGQVVKLEKDIALANTLTIKGQKTFTLDINGHDLTMDESVGKVMMNVGTGNAEDVVNLTLTDTAETKGKIESKACAAGICVWQYSSLITKDIVISFADEDDSGNNPAFQVQGDFTMKEGTKVTSTEIGVTVLGADAKFTMDGGEILTDSMAVSGNGIAVYGGTEIVINDGTLTAKNAAAIYHPQDGMLTLNGGEITGTTGVQMCAGNLDVPKDSTVKVTGTSEDNRGDKKGNDGTIDDGAAISIINRNYPGGEPTAAIKGGTFISEKTDHAVITYTWSDTDKEYGDWNEARDHISISGGTYNTSVNEDFLKDGFEIVKDANGNYTVKEEGGGGIIIPPTNPVQKPVIEAEEGATVTLSKDGTTATIVIDKDATLKDVLLNGESLGAVTEVKNLKTGDKLVVVVETLAEKNARLKAGVENTTIKLKSTLGKGHVRLDWNKSEGYKVDKYQVFRSTKRYSGYGTKAYFTTKQGGLKAWYKNTKELKKGNRYYYKVRGVREIAGETVYTQWSNKAWRTIK